MNKLPAADWIRHFSSSIFQAHLSFRKDSTPSPSQRICGYKRTYQRRTMAFTAESLMCLHPTLRERQSLFASTRAPMFRVPHRARVCVVPLCVSPRSCNCQRKLTRCNEAIYPWLKAAYERAVTLMQAFHFG